LNVSNLCPFPLTLNLNLDTKTSVLRDYSLDNKSQGRQSLASQKHGPESDMDSMEEYGDNDVGKRRSNYWQILV
jgi:hypothetical protein